jgi:hypothetical protein
MSSFMSIFSSFTSIFVKSSLTANLTVPLPSSSAMAAIS